MVYEAQLLGFEFLELGPALPPVLLPGFHRFLENDRQAETPFLRFSGVHGFCTATKQELQECHLSSSRAAHRERAVELVEESIDLAASLGGQYVTLDLGRAAMKDSTEQLVSLVSEGKLYDKTYAALKLEMVSERLALGCEPLDRTRQSLDVLVPYAQQRGVQLGLEIPSAYEQVPNEREMETLLAEYDTPTVAYWHNFGHVQRRENLALLDHAQWLETMAPRLVGGSIHDVVWPAEEYAIPFHGSVGFDQLLPLLPEGIPLVWQMAPRRKSGDIKRALITWKEKYGD